jgi:C4-type Zn-finger protein
MSLRALFGWAGKVLMIPGGTRSTEPHAAFRRCPQCGAREFRLSDRQRARPDVYRSRVFLLKWLCLACAYRETETVEDHE